MIIKFYQNYLIKTFVKELTIVSLVFISLVFILNVISEIRFFMNVDAGFYYPIFITLLNIPSVIFEIFPFIFLISTQLFFVKLYEKNELIILKNYGIDNLKLLKILVFTSILIGFLITTLFYTFSSSLKHSYLYFKNQHSEDQKYLAVVNQNGLWIPPGMAHGFLSLEEKESQVDYLARKSEEMRNRAMETIGKQGEEIAQRSAEVIKSAWSGLLGFFAKLTYLAVIPIYLFYFLSSNRNLIDELEGELGFLGASLREDIVFLIREFVGIMVAFFRGQLLIGFLMGIGYAIGFTLSGLKFGIALGLLFGLLNIVPYLGSIVGIVTALLVAYLQPGGISETGEWTVLLGCGASFVVVQLIESYYLTPKIMGQQTGLHPVVVIVSIFFWGSALGGILGMIFGIPLTAFIIIAWRLVCRKYFNRELCSGI